VGVVASGYTIGPNETCKWNFRFSCFLPLDFVKKFVVRRILYSRRIVDGIGVVCGGLVLNKNGNIVDRVGRADVTAIRHATIWEEEKLI